LQNYDLTKLIYKVKRYRGRFYISCFWILGLLVGCLFARNNPWNFITVESVAESAFAPMNALIIMLVPFALGCVACVFCQPLFYIFLILKGFIFAIASINIAIAFGDAGWLARLLLLSTDSALVFILLLYAMETVGQGRKRIKRNTVVISVVSGLIISIEWFIIIPFTTSLLNS